MDLLEAKKSKTSSSSDAVKSSKEASVDEFVDMIASSKDLGQLWEMIGKLRNFGKDRASSLADFQEMANDSTISSALEMYADDATHDDYGRNLPMWVESSNVHLEKELNTFLVDVVMIKKRIWSWAYNIALYGEVFLKTFSEDFPENGKIPPQEMYFEEVEDPLSMYAIEYKGVPAGFFKKEPNSLRYFKPSCYIHFISDRLFDRKRLKVSLKNKKGQKEEKEFMARVGISMLYNARGAWKIMKVLEDALIMARLARSSFFRIVQVEVGRAGNRETLRLINDVKRRMKSREVLDLTRSIYRSDSNPIPANDMIYVPVRDGKGQISMENVGGDVDIKEIADMDYFSNKFYGSIRIPKTFLGFEQEFPGQSGSALTKLDLRYSRAVKRVQNTLVNGVKDLCNFYLYNTNQLKQINKFEVMPTALNTSDFTDFIMDYQSRVQTAQQIWDLYNSITSDPDVNLGVTKNDVAGYVWRAILQPRFSREESKVSKVPTKPGEENPPSGEEEGDGSDYYGGEDEEGLL